MESNEVATEGSDSFCPEILHCVQDDSHSLCHSERQRRISIAVTDYISPVKMSHYPTEQSTLMFERLPGATKD